MAIGLGIVRLAIVISLVVSQQRTRHTVVEERRDVRPPL
jgi:hypothetical protein